ncbi:MAG: polyprenyl diphosphate synthase [Candidatus Dojkabacteria bacterium]|nr:MAG: polyprenyl diphosphate synthase [Candidatus Dojkabacteria bacterium]
MSKTSSKKQTKKKLFTGENGKKIQFGARKIEGGPRHVAIICDGNRRWAEERGLTAFEGHKAGAENVLMLAERGIELGIEDVTLWGWSTENWQRGKDEVKFIMQLFIQVSRRFKRKFLDNNVKFRHIGRKDRLPKKLLDIFHDLEERTKNNTATTFSIALDYGSQDEIVRAVKQIVEKGIPADEIDTDLISSHLDTAGLIYPDMIIRTGGEQRLSGFLLWQSAYAELFFVDEKFPELTPDRFEELVLEYATRKRSFGGNLKEVSYLGKS